MPRNRPFVGETSWKYVNTIVAFVRKKEGTIRDRIVRNLIFLEDQKMEAEKANLSGWSICFFFGSFVVDKLQI